jgi:UDP-3-O-[3-hydroxymyristoyl] glucosamine N-acyltransferase
MEKNAPPWTLGQLAALLGGELHGPHELVIEQAVDSEFGGERGITFAESAEYLLQAEESGVAAVLVPFSLRETSLPSIALESPRTAFFHLLSLARRELPLRPGVHPSAIVDPEAHVHPGASIGPYAVVERGARIGAACRVFAFCYVGENCSLGEGTILYPHAVLYQDVSLGERTIVHAGCVLGADGFGYFWDGSRRVKIPQVGRVEIGADVEMGALSSVDRATAGVTRIGRGTKLDNLVQIGHNTRIGEDGAIAAQTGIGGSSRLGDRVVMAGQCASADHVRITDDVTFGGRSAAGQDVKEPGVYLGAPARPIREASRAMLLATKLPDLFSRLRSLEKKLKDSS